MYVYKAIHNIPSKLLTTNSSGSSAGVYALEIERKHPNLHYQYLPRFSLIPVQMCKCFAHIHVLYRVNTSTSLHVESI